MEVLGVAHTQRIKGTKAFVFEINSDEGESQTPQEGIFSMDDL